MGRSEDFQPIARRDLLGLLGLTGAAAWLPAGQAYAQARGATLVIGIDISDTITLDPVKQAQYTPPITLAATYDALMTLAPGDYIEPKPALATAWRRTPDGKGWRFTLREGVKFASGATMTAEDVQFSFQRLLAMKEQTQQYLKAVDRCEIVDAKTIDLVMNAPAAPLLNILCAPSFGILEKKVVEAQGGSMADDAKEKDKATDWLNQNSAGTGPYRLVRWERNQQIQLARNPHHWRGAPAFERVVIRHFSDSAAQLLAVRRGDIQAAFNLIPEQIATLRDDPAVRAERLPSLDFVYMALTQNPEFNRALAQKPCRQAIGHAIDYDGITTNMLGGAALRPAHFLPIGVNGSTEEIAREIGFRQDLEKAKRLLQEGGFADGFEFEIAYGNAAVAGVSYQLLAQKIQADLTRVGIRVRLNPMDQVNLRTAYTTGRTQGGVLTFWNPPAVENELWAAAVVERVARRVHWPVPPEMTALVKRAAEEPDVAQAATLWVEWQRAMVDQANHFILFQPIYQIAVRNTVKRFPLTAAGWQLEIGQTTPA
ncbi:peptide ABC transporter substrate-binding protein [Siccirubricoccus deserti]|uniref:ABC transporter substrate-binding protein n=1 Tax=Siccirubricoccus deserti TaxID=2013562 RepID=A0A9X0UE77_9PROT|nr:ABC transporter substrate-binding protein [Siccirubricoccus deserti]MBC4016453.1 ABC transporter substrate-binding protein [Siccirubricoccus deserti]GGC48927.1 peptide ABC transporter substrate-binding protein [Siccirubricoccus deserti]